MLLALAGSSSPSLGAVTFGDSLAEDPDTPLNCGSLCTASSGGLATSAEAPGGRLAPSDGVVVRWRIEVGVTTTPVALRITRPGSSEAVQRTGAGTGPTVTPLTNQTSTFEVRLPVKAGDALAIDCCANQPLQAFAANANGDNLFWTPPLVDGGPLTMFTDATAGLELLINADMEPDADGDGYGDQSQDQCPADVSKQAECDSPETEITKTPPNKSKKPKAKYKFTSDEPDSTFETSIPLRRRTSSRSSANRPSAALARGPLYHLGTDRCVQSVQ